uniref:Uncharacterized protein n=1 Tax=Catagonus wagneri TaxID=51154 RepID=A0A8C3W623_9CETA
MSVGSVIHLSLSPSSFPPFLSLFSEAVTAQKQKTNLAKQAFCLLCASCFLCSMKTSVNIY